MVILEDITTSMEEGNTSGYRASPHKSSERRTNLGRRSIGKTTEQTGGSKTMGKTTEQAVDSKTTGIKQKTNIKRHSMDDDFVMEKTLGGKCKKNMVIKNSDKKFNGLNGQKNKKSDAKVMAFGRNNMHKCHADAEQPNPKESGRNDEEDSDVQMHEKAKDTLGKKGKSSILLKKFQKVSPKKKPKLTQTRVYKRYIQKKFSPEIFSGSIAGLNDKQKEWVVKTGFGGILKFRMERYPHRLGYGVVESFNKSTSSLMLKDGEIEISESVVNKVLGLPIGSKKVVLEGETEFVIMWAEQFKPTKKGNVTAIMVSEKLKRCKAVDKIFKLNFLVLMSNFLIESNQNGFNKTDILLFDGNLDTCYEYKWCELLITRLKFTHTYWAADPEKRYFMGPLPFLIYLYVDRLQNNTTRDVVREIPAYIPWSDGLLRERQKNEIMLDYFGTGLILQWDADAEHNIVTDNDAPDVHEGEKKDINDIEDDRCCDDVALEECADEKQVFKILDKKIALMGKIFEDCMTSQANAIEKFPSSKRNEKIKQKLSRWIQRNI